MIINRNIQEVDLLLKNFMLSKKGRISIAFQKGEVSKEYQISFDNDHSETYAIGSISKIFLAMYLHNLSNKKIIDLDQPISAYLFLNKDIIYPTVRSCLIHTSGYPKYVPPLKPFLSLIFFGFNRRNIYQNQTTSQLFAYLNHHAPKKNPTYMYSDFNYAVLGVIVESLFQRPLSELMSLYLRETFHVYDTNYLDKNTSKNLTSSWIWNTDNPFIFAGGMISSTKDIMKFLTHIIEHKDDFAPTFHRYHPTHIKNVYTGYSWNSLQNGHFYWHLGGQGYYRSYVLMDIKRRIIVIICMLSNKKAKYVSRLGSMVYRNIKRNHQGLIEYLEKIQG